MESLSNPEREQQPRAVTGLFRLNVRGVPLEFSADGKAQPGGREPRFAIKDVPVLHSTEGWSEFAEILATRLTGVDSELYRGRTVFCVAESPIDQLTENMQPGEIRLVSEEEYADAYHKKYGDAIYIPTFW